MMDIIIEKGLAQLRKVPYFPVIQSKSKYELIDIILTVIGVAFEEVSKRVPELKGEIAGWDEGRRCAMGVLPKGPYISLEKSGDRILYLGKGLMSPDVTFLFKNLDSAVLVLTAQMSAHQAMAECRILLDGQVSYGMEMNRALAIVETYLFPQFILNKIFKRKPQLSLYQLITKGTVYAALLPAFLKNGLKYAIRTSSNS
ncbi:MAG: hypothetical protein ISS63_06180 [Desulfobacteraceae bacterium]|nr:hypothetical protein [Desulfobacteraceae bacterium]